MAELFEMERQRGRRYVQLFSDLSGGDALGSHLYQETKDGQPRFLRKRSEGCHGLFRFHDSKIMER